MLDILLISLSCLVIAGFAVLIVAKREARKTIKKQYESIQRALDERQRILDSNVVFVRVPVDGEAIIKEKKEKV